MLQLDIISPESNIFSGPIEKVTLPGQMGAFQVLKNHAPIISVLEAGDIKVVTTGGETLKFPVESGFVEVLNNVVTVLI